MVHLTAINPKYLLGRLYILSRDTVTLATQAGRRDGAAQQVLIGKTVVEQRFQPVNFIRAQRGVGQLMPSPMRL